MKLIVAVNNGWGIGKGNDLLYHIPTDMKFFRSKTKDNIIIIGRKTLESFPNSKPLPYRTNIVLTRDKSYIAEDTVICNNLAEIFDYIKDTDKDVYVCGGAEIYKLLLPYCDIAYVTKIYDNETAEKFMSDLDKDNNWELAEKSEDMKENGYTFSFCTYKNKFPITYSNQE